MSADLFLFVSGCTLAGAATVYGRKAKWTALLLFLVYLAWNVLATHHLLYATAPVAFWTIVALGTGLPLGLLGIVVADARFGLFSLDTFFGIIFVVALSPVMLLANGLVWLWKAGAS